jgi:dihydrofolate reductase
MRKVVLYHLLSLDGVAFEDGDWFNDGGPELVANLARVIGSQDDILLGRRTYDYWVGHWPKSDFEPFASFINGTRKHVVTSSTPTEEWANTTLVTTPVADYVTALKQESGGDIGILVDELQLVVAPAVVGHGRRVLDGDDASQPVELLDVQRSPKGSLFLAYRCTPAAT